MAVIPKVNGEEMTAFISKTLSFLKQISLFPLPSHSLRYLLHSSLFSSDAFEAALPMFQKIKIHLIPQ